MISFLKFNNTRETKQTERLEPSMKSRRNSQVEVDPDELIENPEVQKARHRLLGAGFLLLVAIIGLPRVFDSEPKKVKNDVVLNLMSSVNDSASPKASESSISKNEVITQANSSSVTLNDQSPSETVIEQSNPESKDQKVKPSPKSIEELIADSKPNDSEKPKSKFYIQVATFSSSDGVKKMTAKLKDLKITSYVVERKKDSDSTTLYQLRAGPFTSKEDAQAALKKMSDLDGNPKIVEIKNKS
jgi:DedD protein